MTGSGLLILGLGRTRQLTTAMTSRRRCFELTEDPSADELRGAILGPAAPPSAVQRCLRASADSTIPLLLVGSAAQPILPVVTGAAPTLRVVLLSQAGLEDPMTGAMGPGDPMPVDAGDLPTSVVEPADVPLLTDEVGGLVLVRRGSVHATRLRVDVGGLAVDDDDVACRFAAARCTSFLIRWLDLVVGRVEEEMPWGRRGPAPRPAPGLYLNPAKR